MYFFDTLDESWPQYIKPDTVEYWLLSAAPNPNGFYCEETVYRDFVIIDMTFRDNLGRYTVLPVISDPIDILGEATPPVNIDIDFPNIFGGDGTASKILSYVLIALVVILTVWLLFKLIPKRVKVVNRSGRRRRR